MPINPSMIPNDDGGSPRTVALLRNSREVSAIGADDGEDAAKQAAIMVLQQEGGLKVEDKVEPHLRQPRPNALKKERLSGRKSAETKSLWIPLCSKDSCIFM
jgi:hypothetical protein